MKILSSNYMTYIIEDKSNEEEDSEISQGKIVKKFKDKREKDKERARESRQKKKDYIKKLEDRIAELEEENKRIKSYLYFYY